MKVLKDHQTEMQSRKPKILKNLTQDRNDRLRDIISELDGTKVDTNRHVFVKPVQQDSVSDNDELTNEPKFSTFNNEQIQYYCYKFNFKIKDVYDFHS